MTAEVRRLHLSATALKSLTPEQRYVFALASHVFNELMLLMKWVDMSRMPPGTTGPREDAAVGVSMFLIRLLASKLYEGLHSDALRRESTDSTLRTDYFRHVDGLEQQWDKALGLHDDLKWLGWIRNKGGFHYMRPTQWVPHLTDDMCEEAYVYVGRRYADTYFHWTETTASIPAMRYVNQADPFKGLEQMLLDLGEILGMVTDCLARGIQAFISAKGLCENLSDPITFDAPLMEDRAGIHYFFSDNRSDQVE